MAEHTAISWCDATWNPWWGCTQISPACDNCYAKTLAARFGYGWNGAPMRLFGEAHWAEPLRWARTMPAKLGRRPRVFSASMGDWLDLDAPIAEFVRLLRLIEATPELDWLLLSKRIGNWRKRLTEARNAIPQGLPIGAPIGPDLRAWVQGWLDGDPPANVVLMATVVNQPEADRDVTKLLAIPARRRGLSIEPMLGPIDLTALRTRVYDPILQASLAKLLNALSGLDGHKLDWVIAGGESGPHARPAHPDWFRELRDQCAVAGVQFHFKQWGEWLPSEAEDQPVYRGEHRHIGGHAHAYRVGKKAAGRLLDGVEHNGLPEAR